MDKKGKSFKMQKQLSTLKIIHAAIFIGPLIFVLFPYLENRPAVESELPLQILAISLVSVPISSFFRKFLASRNPGIELVDKFLKYQTVKIVTWAIVEAAALLNGVFFFLYGSQYSLGAVIAFSLLNLIRFPNIKEFETLFGDSRSGKVR